MSDAGFRIPSDSPLFDAGVHMHSVLAWRGGAARVASMIRAGLEECCVACSASCELNDTGSAKEPLALSDSTLPAAELAAYLVSIAESRRLLHLHGSLDWAACLAEMAALRVPAVLTLHDCSLLTGGCPYPLECRGIFEGCYEPCPRGYADAAQKQRSRLAALQAAHEAAGVQLVAPSGWLKGLVRTVVPQVPCSVIPNGVEEPPAGLSRSVARQQLGIAPEARMVLFMAHGGEQAAYKSGDRWQAVWEEIRSRVEGALCFMVGGESHSRDGACVRWPYLDREHAQLCMAAADCFAYPTIADNHPLVVLEALSLGCPVVAFDAGGVKEQVLNGTTGLLVTAGEWTGFVDACVSVLGSGSLRRSLSLAGMESYRQRFMQQRMVQGYLGVYARFLQECGF
ncbi:glycosyltransferase [Desulfovibrio mangrovi]|uniref:glycosyltransferase n=1 Tax=Desulfovibrio mangrovi TaxID=2976983 RepID=UPI0022457FD3|nr:glycosyltransferase [Desulfovibrio mangrovi]UZP68413.1 glycosyltransferase [Desulfovibrio mangrovi]